MCVTKPQFRTNAVSSVGGLPGGRGGSKLRRVIGTWADVINRANLGMEVMHERNAHNFPHDLATAEAPEIIG